jgi:hypothetical protein
MSHSGHLASGRGTSTVSGTGLRVPAGCLQKGISATAILIGTLGVCLLAVILWDAFETIILLRRVARRFRLTQALYKYTRAP